MWGECNHSFHNCCMFLTSVSICYCCVGRVQPFLPQLLHVPDKCFYLLQLCGASATIPSTIAACLCGSSRTTDARSVNRSGSFNASGSDHCDETFFLMCTCLSVLSRSHCITGYTDTVMLSLCDGWCMRHVRRWSGAGCVLQRHFDSDVNCKRLSSLYSQ